MKRIILCADDYGQNEAISQAIVALCSKKRLSAVSCLTTFPYWQEQAEALKPYLNKIDIGLHFNLSEGRGVLLKDLILKAYTGKLKKEWVQEELNKQVDRFVEAFGQLPNFIDGHQHVHQLPVVRSVLMKTYEEKFAQSGMYIRSTYNPNALTDFKAPAYFKRLMIQALGSYGLLKLLKAKKIPHNTSFEGAYNFYANADYRVLFRTFLKKIQVGGMIMCHPGRSFSNDPITSARAEEFNYFLSHDFEEDCKEFNVSLLHQHT